MSSGTDSGDQGATRTLPAPAAAPAEGGYLLVVDGATSRRVRLPRTGVLLVGRGAEADVRSDSKAVSRRHAEIVVSDGAARVSDLGSHNGTAVNGERVDGARALASGDAVVIGDVTILNRRAVEGAAARRLRDPGEMSRRLDEELEFEERRILEAREACGGVRVRAAEHLGLPLRTLVYKLKQHGITGRG